MDSISWTRSRSIPKYTWYDRNQNKLRNHAGFTAIERSRVHATWEFLDGKLACGTKIPEGIEVDRTPDREITCARCRWHMAMDSGVAIGRRHTEEG